MPGTPDLSIVIPAYNEADAIQATLSAIESYLAQRAETYEILVAADGTDGTRELMQEKAKVDSRVGVIGTPERGGKGKAIRQCVQQARGDVIGFLDADGKVPIEELDRILPWLEREYDIVIGSRALADSRIEVRQPLHRRLGSKVFGVCMHLLVGLWQIRDTQCGFKFFRRSVAKDLFSRQRIDGYMFDVEILHLAEQSAYRIKEVGVHWRDDGDSRLRLVAGNWRNFIELLQIRAGRSSKVQSRLHRGIAASKATEQVTV